jgi:hypothetical protein
MAATANTKTDRHNARTVAPLTLTEPGILRPRKVFINLKTSDATRWIQLPASRFRHPNTIVVNACSALKEN